MKAAQVFGIVIAKSAKWIGASLLLLLGVLLSLTGTETGSKWLIQTLDSQIKQLSIAESRGTFLNELSLEQLVYKESDDFSVTVGDAHLRWNPMAFIDAHLQINLVQVDAIEIKGQPTLDDNSESNTESLKIPFKISLDLLRISRLRWLTGESETQIDQLQVAAKLLDNHLTISKLALNMPELALSAQSEVQLQSDWPLTAEVDWLYQLDQESFSGKLAISGNLDRLNLDSKISGSIESSQAGYISLSGQQPAFDISADWRKLQWPLTGKAQLISRRGDIQVKGDVDDYHARLDTELVVDNQATVDIDFVGHGGLDRMQIEQLQLKPQQGRAKLSGSLSWAQATAFDLVLNASQLNPAHFGADVPGSINATVLGNGVLAGETFQADIEIKQLSGQIQNQPIKAQGHVKLTDQSAALQELEVSAGTNRLLAKGSLSENTTDLNLTIDAPDLSTAWPSLKGRLNGKAHVSGSLQKPVINSQWQGSNIQFEQSRIGSLQLDADYAHATQQQSRLDVSLHNLSIADNKIATLSLQGRGNQGSHQATLDLHSSFGNVKLDADGEWNGITWLGAINQLAITHPQLQQWQLLKPVNLTLTPEQDTVNINLPRSCLIQKQARLCVTAHGSMDHQLDATLLLDSLPLALTKAWLPDEMALIGTLSANAELIARNKNLSADLKATIDDASFLLTDDDQVNHQISFRTDKLQIQYHGDQLKSQVELDVGGHDSIQAEITAGEGNATGVRQLSGKLIARIKDMRFIDGLFSDIRQLQGQLIADLEIGGTSRQPILNGTAKWQNGQLEITRLGSTFTDINVLVNNDVKDQQRLNLTTEIKSGEGQLSAHGYLDLDAEHQFPLQFKLNGENFQISRLPEAEVEISPNLTLNKHDDLIDITGLIKIDSAKIEIKTLPESAIQPSEDEVIITSNQPEPKKENASQLNTNITIDFGDNTHFSGFGLKTRMAGKLDYVTKKDKQRMQGRAEMRDATYRSYGQDLTIRKGEFLFNGPTDNPWLNIEAIRKATNDNVTAILGVSGPLKSPKTRIFSEPSFPESEALAYLVTGKSLKNAGKSEGSTVANAALNYGVGELSWLSDQLGIDEFEFEQSEKIADSAIRLGQYLNPDLYVGVSVGLFASKYAVNIRYRLSEHFNLSTRAGDTQRIELQYHRQAD